MHAFKCAFRIAFGVLTLLTEIPSANAETLQRSYLPDQALAISSEAVSAVQPTATGAGLIATDKTLANGLYMDGAFTYQGVGSNVTLTVDRINNDSFTRTTGTLRLELWAATTRPARGAGFTGYQLATSATLNQLAPRTFYSSVVRTAPFSEPPAGTYWLVLVLSEFNTSCTNNYCVTDSGIFSDQHTFGAPPPPPSGNVTVATQTGDQCYENYPLEAFNLLQQITPGIFRSYSSATSCASLGISYYAGLLTASTSVRVYTSNAATAQMFCAAGLVTSCTNAPPTGPTYTDVWWNPAESGWGVTITHHPGGNAFIAWYTYDGAGNPKWYVAPECRVVNARCAGTLYETNGPAFGTFFNPALVTSRSVGTVSFAFSGPTTGVMSYNVRGITGTKSITRQPF